MEKPTDVSAPAGADPAAQTPQTPRTPSLPSPDPRTWLSWARQLEGGPILLLRAFLGVTFVVAGVQKLASRTFFDATSPQSIQLQLRASAASTPFGSLISPLEHVAVALGIVIAFAEIAIGLATLLGLYSRLAGLGGMFVNLMFFLTVSYNTAPYYYGSDIVFLFAWSVLAIGGAGALSLDAYFARGRALAQAGAVRGSRDQRREAAAMDRRTAIARVGSAGVLGAVALAVGGVAALVGRMVTKAPPTVAAGGTGAGSSGGTGGTGGAGTTPSTTPKGSTGKKVLTTSEIPVGGGKLFNDPYNGEPCWALQPKEGDFMAFSAVCTHLGCTVNYVPSVDEFQCPCHGSVYSASTGNVLGGPAPSPLPKIPLSESGGSLYEAE